MSTSFESLERPIAKAIEHIQDAHFHLSQSKLPEHARIAAQDYLSEANRIICEQSNIFPHQNVVYELHGLKEAKS